MLNFVVPQNPNPKQLKKHFQDFKKAACLFVPNSLPQNNKTVQLSDGPHWLKVTKTKGSNTRRFRKNLTPVVLTTNNPKFTSDSQPYFYSNQGSKQNLDKHFAMYTFKKPYKEAKPGKVIRKNNFVKSSVSIKPAN